MTTVATFVRALGPDEMYAVELGGEARLYQVDPPVKYTTQLSFFGEITTDETSYVIVSHHPGGDALGDFPAADTGVMAADENGLPLNEGLSQLMELHSGDYGGLIPAEAVAQTLGAKALNIDETLAAAGWVVEDGRVSA